MANRWKFCFALGALLLVSVTLSGQVSLQVLPVPIPGGHILPPLFNQFFPGVAPGYDGLNADPHGITNFRGAVATGYTNGKASDKAGHTYDIITDIRVYQGDYVGSHRFTPARG